MQLLRASHSATSIKIRGAMRRMRHSKWISLFVFVLAMTVGLSLVVLPAAKAQESTGGIAGTVRDSSGAVVPHAKVVVSGDALGVAKELETDASGYYHF